MSKVKGLIGKVISIDEVKELPNYYVKVIRVPDDKNKHHYSKIVTQEKADRLLNGIKAMDVDGNKIRVPLKRKYIKV